MATIEGHASVYVPAAGGGGAFDGALVLFSESYTAGPAPHTASLSGATVLYGASYVSGNTFVAPRDGVYRIEFAFNLNILGGVSGGQQVGAETYFTGWAASNDGYGPMSSFILPADASGLQVWPASSMQVPMHAGDTTYLSVFSVNGRTTDIDGQFAIQYLGPIPAAPSL